MSRPCFSQTNPTSLHSAWAKQMPRVAVVPGIVTGQEVTIGMLMIISVLVVIIVTDDILITITSSLHCQSLGPQWDWECAPGQERKPQAAASFTLPRSPGSPLMQVPAARSYQTRGWTPRGSEDVTLTMGLCNDRRSSPSGSSGESCSSRKGEASQLSKMTSLCEGSSRRSYAASVLPAQPCEGLRNGHLWEGPFHGSVKVAGSKPKVLLVADQAGVEGRQHRHVGLALHGPPWHDVC